MSLGQLGNAQDYIIKLELHMKEFEQPIKTAHNIPTRGWRSSQKLISNKFVSEFLQVEHSLVKCSDTHDKTVGFSSLIAGS